MTWQEMQNIIRQEAEATAQRVAGTHTDAPELIQAQTYRRILSDALTAYRDAQDGTPARRFVDKLLQRSRDAAGQSRSGKRLHNLAVLQYIATPAPPENDIKQAFAFKTAHKLHLEEAKAFDRLAVLAFGFCGIEQRY